MGIALQVVTGHVTNPGANPTALTPGTGDSFTVDVFDPSSSAKLLSAWTENATGGIIRFRSPRLHDPAQGLRLRIPANDNVQALGGPEYQALYPGDNLIVESSGGGAEVDVLSYLVYYENLPGISAPLQSWAQIRDRIVNIAGVELNLTSGNTAGDYGGARTLNQDFQNLRAGESYALLGYTCSAAFATLRITGPDTGKLGVGGPGSTNTWDTADWFVKLSDKLGLPLIPVIQANNAGGTVIDMVDTAAGANKPVTLIMAELAS